VLFAAERMAALLANNPAQGCGRAARRAPLDLPTQPIRGRYDRYWSRPRGAQLPLTLSEIEEFTSGFDATAANTSPRWFNSRTVRGPKSPLRGIFHRLEFWARHGLYTRCRETLIARRVLVTLRQDLESDESDIDARR